MKTMQKGAVVKIIYGCYGVGVHKNGSRIEAVITESISGRQAIMVETVVDATGDACIAHLAGVPTKTYEKGNILAAWYYYCSEGKYDLNTLGFSDVPPEEDVGKQRAELLAGRRFTGLDCQEVSEMMFYSHASSATVAIPNNPVVIFFGIFQAPSPFFS